MKRTRTDRVFDLINVFVILCISVVMLYPMYFIVVASISEPYDVVRGAVRWRPVGFTLEAYRNVFDNDAIWRGYGNTLFYTAAGTLWNLALIIPAAYAMSKKKLPGRNLISLYFLFTMYFGGGLVPTYLLVKSLNLLNNMWTVVILGGFSVFYLVVSRVFFETSIPEELYESARIDGAGDFRMFFVIAVPLSAPIVAVIALYCCVDRWNSYTTALIYLRDSKLMPLQMVLRDILLLNQTALAQLTEEFGGTDDMDALAEMMRRTYMASAMKYALIFVSSAPLLAAYPFVQKFFVRGVMIGSLKG